MDVAPAWAAIRTALGGSRERFVQAAKQAGECQSEQLAKILAASGRTEFGARYGLSDVKEWRGYQTQVPVQTYEAMAPYIDRIALGEQGVLFESGVIAFERTGGSSGGAKLIPFTEASLQAIRRAVFAWLDDLLFHRPGILRGRMYWSISPAARQVETTGCGIPIGLPNDAAYFGETLAPHIVSLLTVPPAVAQLTSLSEWRAATRRALLKAEDLSLISVWSPTFLLELCRDLPARWPLLDTVSCWTSGSSHPYADEVARLLPGAYLQGKGLLATEGVVTIPLADCAFPVLAVESGFFEFVDDVGVAHPCTDLDEDGEYEVLLTTYGGLFRYAIGDRVRVRGRFHDAPQLEFVGRGESASDLCGEKLTEAFAACALEGVPGFAMLAPEPATTPRYLLLLDAARHSTEGAALLAGEVEARLRRNPQYDYALSLGQLGPLHPVLIDRPLERYYSYAHAGGRRLGDVKISALSHNVEWLSHALPT